MLYWHPCQQMQLTACLCVLPRFWLLSGKNSNEPLPFLPKSGDLPIGPLDVRARSVF
jgi:hypothetical protein